MTQQAEILERLGIPLHLLEARGLTPFREAEDVVVAEVGGHGRRHMLVPGAAAAWREMRESAATDGIDILVQSAYRSVDRQVEIVRAKLDRGERIEDILRVSAPPGYSEHHTGRAVDIVTPECLSLEAVFDRTPAFQWLERHAPGFAFTLSYPRGNRQGYQYEPWHWCWCAGRTATGRTPG